MSQDQLEYVIRPLARKVMDLTLGRYQVLENHRHRLPEFLTLCASDVENILVAFSKMDVERATSDARASQKMAMPSSSTQQQQHVAGAANKLSHKKRESPRKTNAQGGDDDDDDDPSSMEARARQLEEEDEEVRIASLSHEQYVAELRLQLQRLKTTENFLRSTLSDVLHELDHRTTAVEVKAGQVAQRDQRLTKQREAFLRENRQLRDMVAQYRDKGKCDLPEPILYEWDADDVGSGGGGGGNNSARGGSRGRGDSSGVVDPFQQLRQQFKEEKDTLEKGFVKQLEEANFKVRSLQAQAANAARSKLEQQQQIALLEAQLELLRSKQPLTENAAESPDSPHEAIAIASGPTSPRNHQGNASPPPTKPPQTHVATQTDPNTPRSNPRTPPPVHMLEVDPELHDVLVTRQPTPDGLGANIVRSVSTTALASNASGSQQLTPRTSKLKPSSSPFSNSAAPMTAVRKATAPIAAVSSKQPPHRVQVTPSKGPNKQALHGMAGRGATGVASVGGGGSSSLVLDPSSGSACGADDGDTADSQSPGGASGASPWNDGLVFGSSDGDGSGTQLHQQHQRITSALESTARTPSQLETFKLLEEQIALDQQQHPLMFVANGSPTTPTSPARSSGNNASSPSDKKLHAELHRLRVENEQLRISTASTKVSGASAPHNNSLLLARLKVDLREKSAQLDERTAEFDQLKSEAERWFQVYRQYVPPSDVTDSTTGGHQRVAHPQQRFSNHNAAPLVVNYEVVARLKATVNAAELSEQRYRVLSWKVMDHHVRSSLAREGHLHDIRDAHKMFDMNLVTSLQRQLEMMAFHQQRVYVRLRTRRAESRVESDILWDQVLTMARNVSKLQAVEENPETPRYYLRNQQIQSSSSANNNGNSPPRRDVRVSPAAAVEEVVHAESTMTPDGPISKSSVYFRVVSNAAAAYSLQQLGGGGGSVSNDAAATLNLSRIPVRGVAAASPATLLPQRPQSASASLGGGGQQHAGSSNSLPQKLRAAVTRPVSAVMARHGGRKPASSSAGGYPDDERLHSFQPSELRNLSGDDRRAKILLAMGKDKSSEARNKLQLVEERRLLRASSSAARCPDMSRVEQPVFHMAKLIGRNEAPM
ncbi:Hypothetical protein, putative [Bodo saltans]|uniref:Uncharacterized protein n=1 Tax=Bodo saltans TaxID=75058 RepID=A0A0S4JDL9_BODSA|nr:Hypothetical protein, putative [Bodo saltans]|eukprot:CUG89660.1 Hypothetical protein, putative [Bodo saltans]